MRASTSRWVRFAVGCALALSVLAGCRGAPSSEPPVHLNPNMDTQDKYKPQRASTFFADGRAMRAPPAGTVGRDMVEKDVQGKKDDRHLRENDAYWRGQDEHGEKIGALPVPVDLALLTRGRQRYDIFCAPCHDQAGYGKGPVTVKAAGKINVPSYHQEYMRKYPDGHLFDVIGNGSASQLMMGYKHQIPVADRWAIVAYVRALQRSQNATLADIPAELRGENL
jgi:mono/diheme cytochrome c family protein